MEKDRLTGLDCYRVLCVLIVFIFHQQLHLQCSYGIFTRYVVMGAIHMTAFFLLSGYVLFHIYNRVDLKKVEHVKRFIFKRCISILPLYYLTSTIYVLVLGKENLKQNLILAPFEILGIQSMFTGLSSISHNGGTWFISCILICYILFPYIQEIIKGCSIIYRGIMLLIFLLIVLWAPWVADYFGLPQVYSNVWVRLFEFCIGVILASLESNLMRYKIIKKIQNSGMFLVEVTILVFVVSLAFKKGFYVNNYLIYNIFALPIFICMLISCSGKWKIGGGIF